MPSHKYDSLKARLISKQTHGIYKACLFVSWLLNTPATCEYISGMDLRRQVYVLPHKLQIQLSTSPSHSILTPGRPVPVLTLERQAPGRVATGVPILKSLIRLDPEKIRLQAGFEPRIFRSPGGRLNHLANEAVYKACGKVPVYITTI